MYALVEISGTQFEVEPGDIIEVPRLKSEPEQKVEFNKVLLAGNDGKTVVGQPYVEGRVEAEVLEHFKGEKVLVFKKKRRKGYRKLNGHRQWFTLIGFTKFEIDGFDTEEVEITLEEIPQYDEEILDEEGEITEEVTADEEDEFIEEDVQDLEEEQGEEPEEDSEEEPEQEMEKDSEEDVVSEEEEDSEEPEDKASDEESDEEEKKNKE